MWYIISSIILIFIIYLVLVLKDNKEQKIYDYRVELAVKSHFNKDMFTEEYLEDDFTQFVLNKTLYNARKQNAPIFQTAAGCVGAIMLHDIKHMPMQELIGIDVHFTEFQEKIRELERAQFVRPNTLESFRATVIPELLIQIEKRKQSKI